MHRSPFPCSEEIKRGFNIQQKITLPQRTVYTHIGDNPSSIEFRGPDQS